MTKLVICKGIWYSGDCKRAIIAAKAATPRGFKKDWEYNIYGGYQACLLIQQRFSKKYAFLLWHGSEEQYLITRLTENTGLIKSQVDIDIDSKEWRQIIYDQRRFWTHYEDRKRLSFHEELCKKDRENIFNSYIILLEPIKKELFE